MTLIKNLTIGILSLIILVAIITGIIVAKNKSDKLEAEVTELFYSNTLLIKKLSKAKRALNREIVSLHKRQLDLKLKHNGLVTVTEEGK